jgi:hypothetical protein
VIIDLRSFSPAILHSLPFWIPLVASIELLEGHGTPGRDACATTISEIDNSLVSQECIGKSHGQSNKSGIAA